MFEAAELGRSLTRKAYKKQEAALKPALLQAQQRLRELAETSPSAAFPVYVIVAGVEGAGKGDVVSLLHTWMDVRGIETTAFWDETDEERMRPRYWRFWRAMPPRGRLGVLFGSWYTQPIIDRALDRASPDHFDRELDRIRQFEHMLVADGALVIKLWYHLSQDAQAARIQAEADGHEVRVSPLTKSFAERYATFVSVSERALRRTDVGESPWHIIEADDEYYRDIRTGEIVLESLQRRLDTVAGNSTASAQDNVGSQDSNPDGLTVLSRVPLDKRLQQDKYERKLERLQKHVYDLAWEAHNAGRNAVAVFEGWDAAGKGGALRRLTGAMDARLYKVISVAAPTDEELAHHYLWRFWRQLPRQGYFTLYDRSWYGRVLVERVEQFAQEHEWRRAYSEINAFEEQLVEHGTAIVKFWLHIDPDEQLRRFRERETVEWKRHKITPEDWRNRERWGEYEHAVSEMVQRTSTELAPWTLVPANDKRHARIHVLKTFANALEQALGSKHPDIGHDDD